ncbi:MAG: primosomal protein N' [SAR202 cluster bacterium Casp-Chloro-G2]|nr:MAG: primosomal protein N' [SAR202 cluster bacterium Casp-Chloro-G2]
MRYAEVAVDAAVGHSRTFSYSIPPRFTVEPGQLVWVPFGRRVLQGLVVELVAMPNVPETRDILQPVEPSPLISPHHIQLGRWISAHYRCSLFTAFAPLLPPGFEAHVRSRVTAVPGRDPANANLRPESLAALASLLGKKTGMEEADFAKLLGAHSAREMARLVDRGLVRRRLTMPRPSVAPKYDAFLIPSSPPEAESEDDEAPVLPPRQEGLLAAVREERAPYPASLANKEFGSGVAQALFSKGLVAMEWVRADAATVARPGAVEGRVQHTLTSHQSHALAQIQEALDGPDGDARSFLLHGITGSGKTEVYLRAIDRVVREGRQAIFLVPEIALTPQTLERVNAWFPGRVAVIHSRLTPRQQFDQWWDIREGKYDVVVGPRSSLFAPVAHLGLIVIDEEHEWTYKQIETHPLYHTRATALELGRISGFPVVMGSATPDVETYHAATRGRHTLLELPERVSAGPDRVSRLAEVQVCDMRRELREGNRSIFSRALAEGLKNCLAGAHQAILFLNRRGASSIVQCRDCGHVVTCRSCSMSLTCHLGPEVSGESRPARAQLVCHGCNRRTRMPAICPACRGEHIRQLGAGTQRVVEEVKKMFPQANVDRLDADATRSGQDMEDTIARLSSGDTQVLVGTQMVAKGLDIPNVTLVGVVLADIGLYLPDFRAGERAFGLLCQVAGRAGRGEDIGQVIVQTYNPDHYAIKAAAAQDYQSLYRYEINARREVGSPPFNQLVHLVFQDRNESQAERQATETARTLALRAQAQGVTDVDVVGPAPGVPSRVRGRYRWHLTIRGQGLLRFIEGMEFPPGCTVDVDPVHVL